MEPNSREFYKQCAFQKFCNTVLHNEACDTHRELRRHKATGFLEVGVWNRFIGFWENAVGFSTALLLDLHQSGILQFPQGVHSFLPPTVEQVNHFTDGVIQENPSAVIRPPILAG